MKPLKYELVVFDLEATSVDESTEVGGPTVQRNDFIIEIGAVLLDRELRLVDTFEQLVRPEEPITPFITELTSITNEMVAGQPLWKDAAPKFEGWLSKHVKSLKHPKLCAWGAYFDVPLLRRCYQRYRLAYPFSGTCFDAKTFAMLWCSLSGRRTDKLGVDDVAGQMGIEPEGQLHRALSDARVEARIVQRIFADLDGGAFVPEGEGRPYSHVRLQRVPPARPGRESGHSDRS